MLRTTEVLLVLIWELHTRKCFVFFFCVCGNWSLLPEANLFVFTVVLV